MNTDSSVFIELIISGDSKGFSWQVQGLNLVGRDVLPNSHVVDAPWWHVLLAVFVSFWPFLLLPYLRRIGNKLFREKRPIIIIASAQVIICLLFFFVVLTYNLIASTYDSIRLVL